MPLTHYKLFPLPLEVLVGASLEVVLHHVLDEAVKSDGGLPAELALGLGGVAEEEVNLGGAEVAGVDADNDSCLVQGKKVGLIVCL